MKYQTQRTRIKICGITDATTANLIAELGADSIGLVFHRNSPRFLDVKKAIAIKQSLPAFVSVTALFMDEKGTDIHQVLNEVKPDYLQFHGSESAQFCEQWGFPYIKSIPMGSVDDIEYYARPFLNAHGFLLDSNVAGRQGGSGDTFNWSKIPSTFQYPLILAGGLNPQNVSEAITQVAPWAVDVSSGVEKEKGIKDIELVKQFCKEVFRADSQR